MTTPQGNFANDPGMLRIKRVRIKGSEPLIRIQTTLTRLIPGYSANGASGSFTSKFRQICRSRRWRRRVHLRVLRALRGESAATVHNHAP
jgi:hypothetical protein